MECCIFLVICVIIGAIIGAVLAVPAGIMAAASKTLCPYCRESIDKSATRCPKCTSEIKVQ